MSEYQYYEFQTVDRPLTIQEQEKISALSSRVQLTATSAVFIYSYGDFRGDPAAVLAQYFDAMFYLANWGRRLACVIGRRAQSRPLVHDVELLRERR